jgi:hypothetical protein
MEDDVLRMIQPVCHGPGPTRPLGSGVYTRRDIVFSLSLSLSSFLFPLSFPCVTTNMLCLDLDVGRRDICLDVGNGYTTPVLDLNFKPVECPLSMFEA